MKITRELNKKFPIYSYIIYYYYKFYSKLHVLSISPLYHIHNICYNYALDVIVLVSSIMFQTYNIIYLFIIQEKKRNQIK